MLQEWESKKEKVRARQRSNMKVLTRPGEGAACRNGSALPAQQWIMCSQTRAVEGREQPGRAVASQRPASLAVDLGRGSGWGFSGKAGPVPETPRNPLEEVSLPVFQDRR